MSKEICARIWKGLCKSDLTQPGRENWVPDEASSACNSCAEPFTLFNRRHHCRACGMIYCGTCCFLRVELHRTHYTDGETRAKRVCASCWTALQQAGKNLSDGDESESLQQGYPTFISGSGDLSSECNSLCGQLPAPGPAAVEGAELYPAADPVVAAPPDVAAPVAQFVDVADLSDFAGPVWEALCVSQPKFAGAIRRCADCSTSIRRFENESEDVFTALRVGIRACPLSNASDPNVVAEEEQSGAVAAAQHRGAPSASPVSLSDVPGKVHVWRFLDLVRSRRRLQRRCWSFATLCFAGSSFAVCGATASRRGYRGARGKRRMGPGAAS